MNDRMSRQLSEVDPEIAQAIANEENRQHEGLELIASENFVSEAVLEATGSVFTNKYAEGYPAKRYYGGCEFTDVVENLARERAKQLFGAEYANVQPHSGSSANMAAYAAVIQPGDTIMGLDLAHGGHLTHGHKLSFCGKTYRIVSYGVTRETETLDYDEMQKPSPCASSPSSSSAAARPIRASSISPACGRSPTKWEPSTWLTWRTLPAWSPEACIPRPCRTPRSSPPPRTRLCAAPAPGMILANAAMRSQYRQASSPAPGRPAGAHHRRQGRLLQGGAAARLQGLRHADRRQRQGAWPRRWPPKATASSPAARTLT